MTGISCDLPGNFERATLKRSPIWSCTGWGLPSSPVTRRTGALLPHLFTLTPPEGEAVYFLLHFPSRCRDSTLWSTLPCGVRTFLEINHLIPRSFRLLRPIIGVFPVNNPMTIRTKLNIIKTLKFIISLGGDIHIAAQT